MPTMAAYRHRWSQAMCIYGAMPGFKPLLKMISPPYANRANIWEQNPYAIAGPNAFREVIRGQEEYDPDYLVLRLESFYPNVYDFP